MHSEVHVEGKQRGEHLNQVSLPRGDALGGDQDTFALTWLHTRFSKYFHRYRFFKIFLVGVSPIYFGRCFPTTPFFFQWDPMAVTFEGHTLFSLDNTSAWLYILMPLTSKESRNLCRHETLY